MTRIARFRGRLRQEQTFCGSVFQLDATVRRRPFSSGVCVATQTKAREPSSDKAREPERGPDKFNSGEETKVSGKPQSEQRQRSLRDRLRQHWVLAAAVACIIA